MEAPKGGASAAGFALYGEDGGSINRRLLIGSLAALAIPAPALAGGIDRLWWRGRAHVESDGRSLDLTVETSLRYPFIEVRSTSFITAQGPQTARTLVLEPTGTWLERGGKRTPLPPQLGVHERQQYAIYAWLLFVQQEKHARRQVRAARGRKLGLTSPPWPDVVFDIGPDGFPTAAEWTVEDAEVGKPPIAQRIAFSGRIDSNAVRWPRRFDMTQRGRPYFALDITDFRAS